jgi:hypothetical protein
MSTPQPFPYAALSRRALNAARRALSAAKRAAQAGDRAALARARNCTQRHATTAHIFYSAAGPEHPDAAALADYHRRATAALADALSLALPTPTTTTDTEPT